MSKSLSVFGNKLPIGVAFFDTSLHLVRHNQRFGGYFNLQQDSLVGQHLRELLPLAWDVLQPAVERALRLEAQEVPGLLVQNGQNQIFGDVSINAQLDEEGNVSGLLLVANDVTDRVLSQQLLERRVADRTRKLSALYDILAVSAETETGDIDSVLHACLLKVLTATYASAGAIQLRGTDDDLLHLRAQAGLDQEVAAQMATLTLTEGLSGWAASHDETLILNDITSDQRSSTQLRASNVNVYVGVPMNAKGKVVGVLSIFRERQRPFTREDIALLGSVADQIGIVIENLTLRADNEKLIVIEERNRLARELHDAVTQSLYSLMLFAGATRRQAELGDLQLVQDFVGELELTAKQAIKEMRLLLHNLRPAALNEVGLVGALRQRLDAVEGRAGVKSTFTTNGELTLPQPVEEAIFYICYEALNNALKHAKAGEVKISIEQSENNVALVVRDDGIGFELSSIEAGGIGLNSMHERCTKLQGTMSIDSAENGGTTVRVLIPLEKA